MKLGILHCHHVPCDYQKYRSFLEVHREVLERKVLSTLMKNKGINEHQSREFWNCGVSKRYGCGEVLFCQCFDWFLCLFEHWYSVTFATARDVMLSFGAPLSLTHFAAFGLCTVFSVLMIWVDDDYLHYCHKCFLLYLMGVWGVFFLKLFTITFTGC